MTHSILTDLDRWLHRRADRYVRRYRMRTLQATALVHEAVIKLLRSGDLGREPDSRALKIAGSRALREVVIAYTRHRYAKKRWPGARPGSLDRIDVEAARRGVNLVELDAALDELARRAPRQARVIELRFFGGLTVPEVARTLGVGETTVETDWAEARRWLDARLAPYYRARSERPGAS